MELDADRRTCESANWGRLPSNWRAVSLRAGPLWFVGDRLFGYLHGNSSQGARRTIARHGRLRDNVMIVEVTDGSTAVMKAAAEARPYFRFMDGFGSNLGNPLPWFQWKSGHHHPPARSG